MCVYNERAFLVQFVVLYTFIYRAIVYVFKYYLVPILYVVVVYHVTIVVFGHGSLKFRPFWQQAAFTHCSIIVTNNLFFDCWIFDRLKATRQQFYPLEQPPQDVYPKDCGSMRNLPRLRPPRVSSLFTSFRRSSVSSSLFNALG